jgi:hypothetical protein
MKEAFRIEPDESFVPSERQKQIIDKLADWVVRRKLTLPAVMTLESLTPLNYLGSQTMVFFQPFATVFLNPADYKEFQQMLEHRDSIHFVIQAIETREQTREQNKAGGNSAEPQVKE